MCGQQWWALVALVGVTFGGFSGCGKSEPQGPASSPPPATPDATTPTTPTTPSTSTAPPAEGWGDLTGSFVLVGTPPEPMKLNINKDVEVCAKHAPVDESVVVSEDGALANVVVFVRSKVDKVHPDYEATAEDRVVVDNLHCRFEPHVSVLRTSQTLVLKNSDPMIGHNTKADPFANQAFNVLIPAGEEVEQQLPKEERLPVPVGCNIHPWMSGYVVVRDNPYATVSAADGSFTIKNLPSGEHEIQFWQEKAGYLDDLNIGGQVTKKGRVKLTIQPGANDLGKIEVPAEQLTE